MFKHLPKMDCCNCIKEYLLPQRSSDDIRKQLTSITNTDQRDMKLKDLLKKQNRLDNYDDFIKEIHYKSPFEQSDQIQLPPMYTVINY